MIQRVILYREIRRWSVLEVKRFEPLVYVVCIWLILSKMEIMIFFLPVIIILTIVYKKVVAFMRSCKRSTLSFYFFSSARWQVCFTWNTNRRVEGIQLNNWTGTKLNLHLLISSQTPNFSWNSYMWMNQSLIVTS